MSDLGTTASWAYDHGIDPITYATAGVIQTYIETWLTIRAERHPEPGTTIETVSLWVLGELLDAGWKPPEVTT